MIEKFEDLGLDSLSLEDSVEGPVQPITIEEEAKRFLFSLNNILQDKLGVTVDSLKQKLSDYVVSHAEELTHEFVNIAPHGDYSILHENNDSMAEFLKTEANKVENWRLQGLTLSDIQKDLISFHFGNKSVDDGDVFEGFVYVSFTGKIKHVFAQGNDN